MSRLFIISVCVGGDAKDFYYFRKNLSERNIKIKRLNKKTIYFLENLQDILKGSIYVIYMDNDYTLQNYLDLITELENTKKFIVIGLLNKNNVYTLEFFKNIVKNNYSIFSLIHNVLNISLVGIKNNIKLLSLVKNANNKSISKGL